MESTSTTQKMKAIIQEQTGGAETLIPGEVDLPIPKEGEVLIKIEYSALNRADIMQRKGTYPPPPGSTSIIGLECAGYIVNDLSELQDEKYKQNRRVMALLPGGGYAQFVTVHQNQVMDIPESFSFEQAAAIPEVWCTAFQILVLIANIQKNETVLVHAAAAGVGTSMIQLCKKYGAKVIAVSSSEKKLKFCQELGADYLINYKENPDFSKLVQEYTNGKGVDVIADPVLASNFQYNIDSLAMDGRWVVYGTMGGTLIENSNFGLLLRKRANIQFTTLRNRTIEYKGNLIQRLQNECLAEFNSGLLKPIVDKVYGFSQIQEAHQYMESNESIGKILIKYDL
eukprot:403339254